jgi:hypothetical protein
MNHLKGARQLVEPAPVSVPNEATETAAFKRDSSSERRVHFDPSLPANDLNNDYFVPGRRSTGYY